MSVRKPSHWSFRSLPSGGFSAVGWEWFEFFPWPFTVMTCVLGWAVTRNLRLENRDNALAAGAGMLVFGTLAFFSFFPKRRVALYGTRLVTTHVHFFPWKREVISVDTEDLRALAIRFTNFREEDGNTTTRWELHATLASGTSKPILWGLLSQEEAAWIKERIELASGRGGPAAS